MKMSRLLFSLVALVSILSVQSAFTKETKTVHVYLKPVAFINKEVVYTAEYEFPGSKSKYCKTTTITLPANSTSPQIINTDIGDGSTDVCFLKKVSAKVPKGGTTVDATTGQPIDVIPNGWHSNDGITGCAVFDIVRGNNVYEVTRLQEDN